MTYENPKPEEPETVTDQVVKAIAGFLATVLLTTGVVWLVSLMVTSILSMWTSC